MSAGGLRIDCCIAGCRRTFPRERHSETYEIICGRHWRMADTRLRDRHKALRKRCRKITRLLTRKAIHASRTAEDIDVMSDRFERLEQAAWNAIKEDVTIKAAFGAEDAPRRKPRAT